MTCRWLLGRLFSLLFSFWVVAVANAAEPPKLFLPKVYHQEQPVVGWLMSEKLDGVRAYWNGRSLRTRGGHDIAAPDWFLKGWPPFELDGELWTKRGDFENIVSIVRQQQPDTRWQQISFQVFEVPNQPGGLLERLAVLKAYLTSHPIKQLQLIEQVPVRSEVHLQTELKTKIDKGAEGLILRAPNRPYETGRTVSALKVKTYLDDECRVVAYTAGKGRLTGKVGALVCEWKSQKIRLGTGLTDQQRTQPPPLHSWVTFKYYGLTSTGKPRFPVFLRVRDDADLN